VMTSVRRLIAAALVVLLVGACTANSGAASPLATGSPTPTAPPTPTPATTPTASPEPTPDLAAFGELYLALVETRNDAVCAFNAVYSDPSSGRPQLQDLAVALEAAERTFIDDLRDVEWPPDVQEAIDDLVSSNAAYDAHLRAAIGAATDQAFLEALNQAVTVSAEGAEASQLVRILLGLEGIPTNACG
jgi:hypothetical protein